MASEDSERGKTAYITGGANGIGRAVAELLVLRGASVCIADSNITSAQHFVDALNKVARSLGKKHVASALEVDVASWDSQLSAFQKAVAHLGRVDYVYPIAGIGERAFIPNDSSPSSQGYVKPDLSTLGVDLNGVLYTISLALQQFRRQERDSLGFRGKIGCVASICGFYCVPTLPVYTAAKHGVTGFVRSYGKYLPKEGITLNAVAPAVVRTGISTSAFYDDMESRGLLTPMQSVVDAFDSLLDGSEVSGEILEVGPKGGVVRRAPAGYLDEESGTVCELLEERGRKLHERKDGGDRAGKDGNDHGDGRKDSGFLKDLAEGSADL